MNELIEGFLKMAEEKDTALSVESLMSEEERFQWETLVKAFDSIDVMNVGRDLKKIHKTYQLKRWQEMSVIAYVKILEMMIRRAKDSGAMDMMDTAVKGSDPSDTPYDGEYVRMNCGLCKCQLDTRYIRYKDKNGNPYCQQCYQVIGGQI